MIEAATDLLNATSIVQRWTQRTYPNEVVLLATAATILETKNRTPVGASLSRLFQHRGSVVVTDRRIVVVASTISPLTVIHALIMGYAIYGALAGRKGLFLLAIAFGILLFQRRPYRRDIPIEEIRGVSYGSVTGISGIGDALVVSLDDGHLQIVTAQAVPEAVRSRWLASTTEESVRSESDY